jgi:uncharacterized protein YcbK (DUF882 family)
MPSLARSASLSGSRCGLDRVWLRRAGISEEISIKLKYDTVSEAQAALGELSWFFRDWKDHDAAIWLDPGLPHILAGVQTEASRQYGSDRVIIVTSGYRTPARNAKLRGAAPNSLHLRGKAADIEIEGFSPPEVGQLALEKTNVGGVGIYTTNNTFTHLDTGRRRDWWV